MFCIVSFLTNVDQDVGALLKREKNFANYVPFQLAGSIRLKKIKAL